MATRISLFVLVFVSSIFLSACCREKFDSLKIGMHIDDVIKILGEPDENEIIKKGTLPASKKLPINQELRVLVYKCGLFERDYSLYFDLPGNLLKVTRGAALTGSK